ncbi:MAG TPA: PVC-type heme-binding CxxCH protein [Verrucomicrobiae bacterium]|nr:PVC-type heme-binding CxxCH protein [Verrucomicrobiae bacterium]
MKLRLTVALAFLTALSCAAEPVRLFLRCGPKTHGPGEHDGPAFLTNWSRLLGDRGAKVDGAIGYPTAAQLDATDVMVMYCAEGGAIHGEERERLEQFLKRGGGLVVIHDSVCGDDPHWWKSVIGGAWEHGHSKWHLNDTALYFAEHSHPIIDGVSNWDFDDEIYWDLHLMPEARILCSAYVPDKRNTKAGRPLPSIYDVAPQMWTLERKLPGATAPYRAFVSIPGHRTKSFDFLPFRAVLLRGIAWAGKRDIDSLCNAEELAALRYHEGGPTAPDKAAPSLKVHPDFSVTLLASEPLINKPISLDWDPAGRLWVAETPEYPFRRSTSGPTHDRISILEDTNADGVMDKKNVFRDGLHLVTSLVFHRDGVIVAQAPDILWLRDTDGDGKADKTVKLFTGFGTNDTHAVLNNFRWGLDGWIYASIGYSRGDVRSGDGARSFGKITDGIFRFRPDGSALEQVCSKASNTWGVDVAPDGEIFFSQANGNHINHVVLSESALSRGRVPGAASFKTIEDHKKSFPLRDYEQQAYAQIDFVGGFTAASGGCIYNGGAWPEKWNSAWFVSEPTVNLVHVDFLRPDGATFIASKDSAHADEEFLASADLWFRPIHARVGPDGALYLLDFYNQAAVHNDPRGPSHDPLSNAAIRPDRDRYFGRIWRVQHHDAKMLPTPRLDRVSTGDLAAALAHPNGWVRQTAARLLVEKNDPGTSEALLPLIGSLGFRGLDEAKAQALWILHQLGQLAPEPLAEAITTEGKPILQKNALRIAAEWNGNSRAGVPPAPSGVSPAKAKTSGRTPTPSRMTQNFDGDILRTAILKRVRDLNSRTRLEAIAALESFHVNADIRSNLVELWPEFSDPWMQSAALGVASEEPAEFIEAAARPPYAASLTNLVAPLAATLSAPDAARIVVALAREPEAADPLKLAALEALTRNLQRGDPPPWSEDIESAFKPLFDGSSKVAAAALPLAARWDQSGALKDDVKKLLASLLETVKDEARTDEQRGYLLASLLAMRQLDTNILSSVRRLLGGSESPGLQRKAIEALGATADPEAGRTLCQALTNLPPALHDAAFAQILKRADWSLALLEFLQSGEVKLASLGPGTIHRLRTHSDSAVALKAREVLDALRGPEETEKSALIAKYTAEVGKPGNVKNGKELFTKNCAACHKFSGEGKETGPDLTGMGAHGAAELLVHILDPNRVVEPNFVAVNIDTKDDQSFTGIVVRENKSAVVLRDATGEHEIRPDDIRTRASSGRSLMPEGFESLGAEGLRDLLAFLCADEARFRLIDLRPAFTADSTRGVFESEEKTAESLAFSKFGLVKAGEVPFEIANPARTTNGNNLAVLRGGKGFSRTLARKVEVPNVGVRATKLHFLGGVGAGAWPCCGESKNEGLPVARVTVSYADGQQEQFVLTNGVVFVDYANVDADVNGSRRVPGLLARGQVRKFSRVLTGSTAIDRITLESFDNSIVPVFVAITAEVSDKPISKEEEKSEPAATKENEKDAEPKPSRSG